MGSDETREVESGSSRTGNPRAVAEEQEKFLAILKDIVKDLRLSRQDVDCQKKKSQMQRYRDVLSEQTPRLRRSLRLMSADLLNWMNHGGPWRAFVVLTGGIITSIILSGVVLFLLFFITATVNVAMLALLGSVAAAGAVIAIFFLALIGIYIAAIAFSACIISGIVFCTVVTAISVSGSIAFWWMIWLGTAKFLQIAQNSLTFGVSPLHNVPGAVQTRGSSTRTSDR